MSIRRNILVLGAGWPLAPMAREAGSARRVAYLGTSLNSMHLQDAFVAALRERGRVVGKNLILDVRYTEGLPERVPALTQELLALHPDIFVAATDVSARAAVAAGAALPIIFILGFDPVGIGLVRSLGRPGVQVTGFSVLNWELNPKRLSLLKEAIPHLNRVALFYVEGDPAAGAALQSTELAGRHLKIEVIRAPIRSPDDFEPTFLRVVRAGAKGVMNVPDSLFFKWRQRLADLAIQYRLAAMFGATEFAEAGMLLAYGTDFKDLYVRAATLVERVLNGTDPASIPVEQANTYELVINRRTARTLGIELPRTLLLQTTRIIE
ncbi:MAG: ABC transporter substrate-binding protein [Burkholderiaceae bacterium]